eukprot:9504092-Pyramimonas_sp.AAC.1
MITPRRRVVVGARESRVRDEVKAGLSSMVARLEERSDRALDVRGDLAIFHWGAPRGERSQIYPTACPSVDRAGHAARPSLRNPPRGCQGGAQNIRNKFHVVAGAIRKRLEHPGIMWSGGVSWGLLVLPGTLDAFCSHLEPPGTS